LVVAQHCDVEAADAGGAGPLAERRQQRGPDAAPLPRVDHFDRHLGRFEVLQPHVAGDPDRRAGRRREGDQRLVVPMVDVEQKAELARAELGLGVEISLVAGLWAEPAEGEGDRPAVAGLKLADRELTRHR
jgi:hypothetical protein